MRRVVVTGIGAVSPIGNSLLNSWTAAKAGLTGIMPITYFDTSESRYKVAGELKGFDSSEYLSQKEIRRFDPFVQYAVAAAVMAAGDAGLIEKQSAVSNQQPEKYKPEILTPGSGLLHSDGVIIGSSRGGISTLEKEMNKKFSLCGKTSRSRISPYLMPATTISMASSFVAQKLGIRGHCLGISNACASGSNAIGEAYRLIRSGYGNPVFCGGTEAPVCSICIEGYGASGALSGTTDSSASRPFDRTRDGFVLAEGACILVLEEYKNALKRGARIYGEITGYGNTTDAFHQTVPSAEGEAAAVRMAMDEAGLEPGDIDFISAHGTSTPAGDKIETAAIKLFFGKKAYQIPVSSVKSMTGHMLAASGALEAAFTFLGMNEGVITPIINLKHRDPECDLDYVTGIRRADMEFSLSHSFGFGGVNAVLVFRRLKP